MNSETIINGKFCVHIRFIQRFFQLSVKINLIVIKYILTSGKFIKTFYNTYRNFRFQYQLTFPNDSIFRNLQASNKINLIRTNIKINILRFKLLYWNTNPFISKYNQLFSLDTLKSNSRIHTSCNKNLTKSYRSFSSS